MWDLKINFLQWNVSSIQEKKKREFSVSFSLSLSPSSHAALNNIPGTLEVKRNDHDELLLLSGEASHARDVAIRELKETEKKFREHDRHRELELKDREFVVKQRRELKKRVEERQKERNDIITKTSSGMNMEDEEKLRKTLLESKVRKTQAEEESTKLRENLKIFEDAFGRIKEATGVSDVEEVLSKLATQESTRENLTKLSKENQIKIEELQETLKKSNTHVEELKYAGPSARTGARKIVDDIEQKITKATENREKHKAKFERVKRILLETQGGVEHLYAKIKHVDVSGIEDSNQDEDSKKEQSIVNILYKCETVLSELQRRVESRRGASGVKELSDMRNEIQDDDITASRPFNRRVEAEFGSGGLMSSPKLNGTSESNSHVDAVSDVAIQDEVDENVTREQMKIASKQRVKQNLEAKRIIEEAKVEVDEASMRRGRGLSGMSSASASTSSSSKKRIGTGMRPGMM